MEFTGITVAIAWTNKIVVHDPKLQTYIYKYIESKYRFSVNKTADKNVNLYGLIAMISKHGEHRLSTVCYPVCGIIQSGKDLGDDKNYLWTLWF